MMAGEEEWSERKVDIQRKPRGGVRGGWQVRVRWKRDKSQKEGGQGMVDEGELVTRKRENGGLREWIGKIKKASSA